MAINGAKSHAVILNGFPPPCSFDEVGAVNFNVSASVDGSEHNMAEQDLESNYVSLRNTSPMHSFDNKAPI